MEGFVYISCFSFKAVVDNRFTIDYCRFTISLQYEVN